MNFPLRALFSTGLFGVCLLTTAPCRADDSPTAEEPVAAGKFQPSWESLRQYETPEWFQNAKFGIWAHWSAQCVPEEGDWYAREMYTEGSGDYKYHVAHYGHPSVFGFKDLDNLWHAEHWDPDRLIDLYKRAGARYFVALANHHDNFDCFDSKYQPWNSVAIGPKKDIIGTWEKAARKAGLRFGVTVHAARTWDWFDVSHGSDKTGPLAGIPYDGVKTKADGHGLWWDGLDPAELYGPAGAARTPEARAAYDRKFYNRTIDLINKYHPDSVYFDDSVLPLNGRPGDYGLKIAAHYYNTSMASHDGRLEAVMTTKALNEDQRKCLVWDIERGQSQRIEPRAWQTDTCIGEWHYHRNIEYKSAASVIQALCDIVSKNGNLLLNIPLRGDGTPDDKEIAVVKGIAAWMDVNKEAIFDTRPWKTFGEGPSAMAGEAPQREGFNEGKVKFTSQDIRYTSKGNTLYAIALGWPADGKLTLKSLASSAADYPGDPGEIHLLGTPGPIAATRDADGLHLTLPAQRPAAAGDAAYVFKIEPR